MIDDRTSLERGTAPDGRPEYRLLGRLACQASTEIAVLVYFSARTDRRGDEVRLHRASYHAYIPRRGDVVRYDNSHAHLGFHRHDFDLLTGAATGVTSMAREEFPTLVEVIDEVERLVRGAGLTW